MTNEIAYQDGGRQPLAAYCLRPFEVRFVGAPAIPPVRIQAPNMEAAKSRTVDLLADLVDRTLARVEDVVLRDWTFVEAGT